MVKHQFIDAECQTHLDVCVCVCVCVYVCVCVCVCLYALALQIDRVSLERLDPGFLFKNYEKRIE